MICKTCSMKILYGTGNPAKLDAMREHLKELDVEIIGLQDMEGEIPEAAEDGATPLENARQKAWTYFRHYKVPVFSCDSGLYIEGLPEELQPGVHVRTVNGKYLSDEEMLDYYGGLAKKYGDLKARYINSICLIIDEDHVYESMDERLSENGRKFLITDKPHSIVRKGFPLDSLSKEIESGRYYYDIEEREADKLVEYSAFAELFKEWGICDKRR